MQPASTCRGKGYSVCGGLALHGPASSSVEPRQEPQPVSTGTDAGSRGCVTDGAQVWPVTLFSPSSGAAVVVTSSIKPQEMWPWKGWV